MKNRRFWLLASVIIALAAAAGIAAFGREEVTVSASSAALTEDGWQADFSAPVKPDAIRDGDIYLLNENGDRVEAEMKLGENSRTLELTAVPPGSYTLHVRNAALAGILKNLTINEIPFTVHEKLAPVSSIEELEAYFDRLRTMRGGAFAEGGAEATEESADSSAGGAENNGDHSVTNNQVAGVDEADTVKTDGSYLYSISGAAVVVTDVRNPQALAKASVLTFGQETYPQQLFLSEDTLVVLGSRYATPDSAGGQEAAIMPASGLTAVFLYDVSDPASPELLREFGAEGSLNGARLTGGRLVYVTNVYPYFWMTAEDDNREIRPHVYDSAQGGEMAPLDTARISILPGTMEGSYSVVSVIDLTDPVQNQVETEGFLGGSEQLYMTEDTLYLTASVYLPASKPGGETELSIAMPHEVNTELFKFRIRGESVEFAASAEVTGTLLNQFSMDEHDGYFRVATTEGFSWDESAPTRNHLFILDEQLNIAGSVNDLAPGERIYSVRYLGDKAYMVTFKETDPLFVIDVADPSAPEVLGELKIPGFSNYLHPLGENHLVGFGYETKLEPVKGGGEPLVVTGGMKLSLFDVSDFENPVEKDTEVIGGQGTYSPLQYDHKALFRHAERELFGFPVTLYDAVPDETLNFEGDGAAVYRITEEGIEEAALLIEPADGQYEDWDSAVQRLVYSGDALFTVANSEVKSYDLNTFEVLGELTF